MKFWKMLNDEKCLMVEWNFEKCWMMKNDEKCLMVKWNFEKCWRWKIMKTV